MTTAGRLLIILAVVVLALIVGSAVSAFVRASVSEPTGIHIQSEYILETPVNDALAVLAQRIELRPGASVAGETALIAVERITLAGAIRGDLTALGDRIELAEGSQVIGKLVALGGEITLAGQITGAAEFTGRRLTLSPSAVIGGRLDVCAGEVIDQRAAPGAIERCSAAELAEWQATWDGSGWQTALRGGLGGAELLFTLGFALGLTALAGVLVTVFPRAFSQMADSLHVLPLRLTGTGCLTLLLVPGSISLVIIALAVQPALGLVLLPVLCVLGLPLLVLFFVGWVTAALFIGDLLLRRGARQQTSPILTALAGSLLLTAAWHLLVILPYGWLLASLLSLVIGAAGLGAVLATRLGRRPAPQPRLVQG